MKTGGGDEDLELRELPEPSPDPDQVKLSIAAAGICGTDIEIIKGTWPCRPPVVLGHEFCGTVAEVGSRVKRFKPGDRVVAANPAKTCGMCYHCLAGNPFMCPERVSVGYMIDGAFAEYLCIDARQCHLIPTHVSFREMALGEPLSVAVHAVIERTTVHAADLVLVSGPGCVGLLTAQIAKLEGATVIVAGIEKDERRLACARELGADAVVNVSRENLLDVVQDYSSGRGADLVYECAGSAASLANCWEAVRKEGTLVPLGVHPGPIQTDFNKITLKELRVIGCYSYVWTSWQRSIHLLAEGKVDTKKLVTHEFPLHQFREAFRATQDGTAIKVVFIPRL
ncbi:MAG: zinc-binding dehydrogenase [Acidobacteria bacterium]|nr:zinc-binding dehydrogenase [Acidobacteriota bacterium]MCI0721526.1 zinc-binding dehydrogenase [Acidobacteriota bacterium]